MNDLSTRQPPPSLADLRRAYPKWTIEPPDMLSVYTAELRPAGGHALHFLAGHDLGELATRLATAEALHLGTEPR
jgi:hypothetical protein